MWIAVMDFAVPPQIIKELKARLEYPIFGYDKIAMNALGLLPAHYKKHFDCEMKPEWTVLTHSVMTGVNVGCMTTAGRILYCTPMYKHIRKVGEETGLPVTEVPLKMESGKYTFDIEAMEHALTPDVTSFILCNPHNPTGRVYTYQELKETALFCKRHNLILISDEIHCELTFEGKHIPAFVLEEDLGVKTITLCSAGKICNIPRLPMGYAIIPDQALREKYERTACGLFCRGETLNGIAFEKAYDGSCDEWKRELRAYLRANRDYLEQRIRKMQGIHANHNEATYLTWIDCTELHLDRPADYFKEHARVILDSGAEFGDPNFVRINFACPHAQLNAALDRMEDALLEYHQRKVRKS